MPTTKKFDLPTKRAHEAQSSYYVMHCHTLSPKGQPMVTVRQVYQQQLATQMQDALCGLCVCTFVAARNKTKKVMVECTWTTSRSLGCTHKHSGTAQASSSAVLQDTPIKHWKPGRCSRTLCNSKSSATPNKSEKRKHHRPATRPTLLLLARACKRAAA